MLTTPQFLADLGFVLAVDNCARNCLHCPAYGSREPVRRMPLDQLETTLGELAVAYARHGVPLPDRVVHCWRISDPLDYWSRLPSGGIATCADVAELWRTHLGQGLYVVTNGAEGRMLAQQALMEFAVNPDLVSQIKITVTPFDRAWGSQEYLEELAADVRELLPLWDLPSTRAEDKDGRRFRINAKATVDRDEELRAFLVEVLLRSGLSRAQADHACQDPTRVAVKPVYDLGSASGDSPVPGALNIRDDSGGRHKPTAETRRQIQYGIRPDRRLFTVDMYAFRETDLHDRDGEPLRWPLTSEAVDTVRHA